MKPIAPPFRCLISSILLPLLLAGIVAGLCRAAAGVSLGLFFGGVAFATLLVPPLVSAERNLWARLSVAFAVALGVSIVWLTALGDLLTGRQWLACSTALLAYAVALCSASSLLLALRCNAILAAGIVTTLGLLWLTWPVWLSHALLRPSGDTWTAWLVPAHPLFAINGVLVHLDTWDRYPLAYTRLTVLNQDVFYALPTGVRWTVFVHGFIGVISMALIAMIGRLSRRRVELPAAADPAAAGR